MIYLSNLIQLLHITKKLHSTDTYVCLLYSGTPLSMRSTTRHYIWLSFLYWVYDLFWEWLDKMVTHILLRSLAKKLLIAQLKHLNESPSRCCIALLLNDMDSLNTILLPKKKKETTAVDSLKIIIDELRWLIGYLRKSTTTHRFRKFE